MVTSGTLSAAAAAAAPVAAADATRLRRPTWTHFSSSFHAGSWCGVVESEKTSRSQWRGANVGVGVDMEGRRYYSSSSSSLLSSGPSSVGAAVASKREDDSASAPMAVVAWPQNLKISAKAKSSPFHGLERLPAKAKQRAESAEGEGVATASALEAVDESDLGPDDDDDDDDDDEPLYDLSTRPQPYRAIPLPQRLHVPVLHFATSDPIGSIHLDPFVFGCDPIRVDILHKVVTYQRNKKRGKRYPARTKTISEVSGSGRKLRQQKGLGRARVGHSRPPHFRGGAKAHGPKGVLQDYTTRLNKKVRRMGLRHALSQKLKEGNLVLVSDLALDSHKTKGLATALNLYHVGGKHGLSAFIVDDATDDTDIDNDQDDVKTINGVDINFKVASGNIPKIRIVRQLGLNVYDILKHEKLFLSLAAVTSLERRLTHLKS